MKVTRFFVCIISVLLIVISGLLSTTASAIIHIGYGKAYIQVDDKWQDVDAYVDHDGDIRVYDLAELYEILPELEDEGRIRPSDRGYNVAEYADELGYNYTTRENALYIDTRGYIFIDQLEDWLNDKYNDDKYDDDDRVEDASVYVNGQRINTRSAFIYQDEAFIERETDLYLMFPKETKNAYIRFSKDKVSIKDLAKRYGYKYRINDDDVYLNNDGKTPAKVFVDKKEVYFEDQQPTIVPPGRTMVPIRSIAELTGADVSWNARKKQVTIKDDHLRIIIWIDDKEYRINGRTYRMDVKPYTENGRTMVPLRFICEALGYDVKYDNTESVDIIRLSSIW